MTSKDILKSSFLEILFENRNKEYGAYALRKYYDVRLATALTIALGSVFFAMPGNPISQQKQFFFFTTGRCSYNYTNKLT